MEWMLLIAAVPAAVVVGVRIADRPEGPWVSEALFSATIVGFLVLAALVGAGMPGVIMAGGAVILAATVMILAAGRNLETTPPRVTTPLPQVQDGIAALIDPVSTLVAYTELGCKGVFDHDHHAEAADAARRVAEFLDESLNEIHAEMQPAGP